MEVVSGMLGPQELPLETGVEGTDQMLLKVRS
jgi:hypothetical protein